MKRRQSDTSEKKNANKIHTGQTGRKKLERNKRNRK